MRLKSNFRHSSNDFTPPSSASGSNSSQVRVDEAGLGADDSRAAKTGHGGRDWPLLPWSRGPLSEVVLAALQRGPGTLGSTPTLADVDALSDDDFSLALYLCYEVNYRVAGDSGWERDPALMSFRAELERVFLARLRDEVVPGTTRFAFEVSSVLDEMIRSSPTPSLSTYFLDTGSLHQFRELCVHRSAYLGGFKG